MPEGRAVLRDWLIRWVRLSVLGFAGLGVLLFAAAWPSGVAYAWLTTGLSPAEQLREGGLVVIVIWPIVGALFGWLHVAGAFMAEPNGPWAVAGVTGCLAALWVIAMRHGRAYRYTMLDGLRPKSDGGRGWRRS